MSQPRSWHSSLRRRPRGVGQGQEHPGLGRHRCGQQRGHLGARQHLGQPLRVAAHGDLRSTLDPGPARRKPGSATRRRCVDGGARALSLLQQVQQVRLNLLVAQQRRGCSGGAGPPARRRTGRSPGCAQQSRATPSHRSCVGAAVSSSSPRSGEQSPRTKVRLTAAASMLAARHHRFSGLVQRSAVVAGERQVARSPTPDL